MGSRTLLVVDDEMCSKSAARTMSIDSLLLPRTPNLLVYVVFAFESENQRGTRSSLDHLEVVNKCTTGINKMEIQRTHFGETCES